MYVICRPAAGANGSAATGPPWSLYVLPSGIYLFVFVARVSVYHARGLFCVFVGLFWVNTGFFWSYAPCSMSLYTYISIHVVGHTWIRKRCLRAYAKEPYTHIHADVNEPCTRINSKMKKRNIRIHSNIQENIRLSLERSTPALLLSPPLPVWIHICIYIYAYIYIYIHIYVIYIYTYVYIYIYLYIHICDIYIYL